MSMKNDDEKVFSSCISTLFFSFKSIVVKKGDEFFKIPFPFQIYCNEVRPCERFYTLLHIDAIFPKNKAMNKGNEKFFNVLHPFFFQKFGNEGGQWKHFLIYHTLSL